MRKVCILVIAIGIFLIMVGTASAEPKSEQVDNNSWFNSGFVEIVINKNIDGEKTLFEKGTLNFVRNDVPDWEEAKNNSFDWNTSIQGSDKISVDKNECSTFKYYTFEDDGYEREYTNEPNGYTGFNGLALNVNLIIPQGYRYIMGSVKANTILNDYALIMIMPKDASEVMNYDRTVKAKLIIHASQIGLMSTNLMRYSGNSIEFDIKPAEVESITFTPKEIYGKIGEVKKLSAVIEPENAINKDITYSSSNPNAVTVSQDGTLEFKAEGNAIITAKATNGKSTTVTVSSYKEIKEKGLSKIDGFTRKKANLMFLGNNGSEIVRSAAAKENLLVIGQCDNYYFVKMESDGKYGFMSKSDIEIPVVDFKINEQGVEIEKGGTKQFSVSITPTIATDVDIKWSVDNNKIARIDSSGKLTALSKGIVRVGASNKRKSAAEKAKIIATGGRTWRVEGVSSSKKNNHYILQGMSGIGNRIYYVKISGKGKDASLYTAKMKGGKINAKTEKYMGKLKGVYHANGMVAVSRYSLLGEKKKKQLSKKKRKEYKDTTYLFIAPINGPANTVYRITVKGAKLKSKKKTAIRCNSNAYRTSNHTLCYRGIAYYKRKFVLQSDDIAYICELKNNTFRFIKSFSTGKVHKDAGSRTRRQGTSCAFDSKGNYYLVYSYAKEKDCVKGTYSIINKVSHIYRYGRVFNTRNGSKGKITKKYKLILSKQMQKKNKVIKFEMEDIFIKGSRIYFGAYGGKGNYNDIFGSTKK